MRFALALLCATLVSALPSELGGDKKKWDGDSWGDRRTIRSRSSAAEKVVELAAPLEALALAPAVVAAVTVTPLPATSSRGCICVPNTSSCTTTTTVTSTGTATATDTVTATDTATATVTNTNTITDTISTTNTITSTNTISTTTTATTTTTTTATSCPTNYACFCCTRQTQLGQNFLTGTCDIISIGTNCPVGNGQGRRWKVCCNGDGQCTQTEQ
ncbi:hypothetical protein N7452_011233 [Penicillium brevicompactum]|uniref:Uncharacterized protein n=1 Tax=Penicillium brevicompactum TaxID=5074 RepID=A0A9W9Q264_PENBR|nr:hypothetical protein N7452_011233 [Penicillium brevicompactum]